MPDLFDAGLGAQVGSDRIHAHLRHTVGERVDTLARADAGDVVASTRETDGEFPTDSGGRACNERQAPHRTYSRLRHRSVLPVASRFLGQLTTPAEPCRPHDADLNPTS